MPNDIEKNKKIARDYFAAVSRADNVGSAAFFAEDGVILAQSNTLLTPVLRGRQTIADSTAGITGAFPNGFKMVIHSLTAEEDRVAIETESFGDHVSGKKYNNRYHFLMVIKNGLIQEMREYLDSQHVTDVIFDGKRP